LRAEVTIVAFVMLPPTIMYSGAVVTCSLDESMIKNPFSRSESILTMISMRNGEILSASTGLVKFLKSMLTS
jgi:hypothetical protein